MEKSKFIPLLAILGLVVSSYLIYYHYDAREGLEGWCNISDRINCQKVLLSGYSEMAGIPLGVFGVIWFLVVLLLGSGRLKFLGDDSSFHLFLWTVIGLFSLLWLIYVEIFLVESICLLCTTIHLLVISIFILSFMSLKKPLASYIRDLIYE